MIQSIKSNNIKKNSGSIVETSNSRYICKLISTKKIAHKLMYNMIASCIDYSLEYVYILLQDK